VASAHLLNVKHSADILDARVQDIAAVNADNSTNKHEKDRDV
jgi:hypothetical protein